MAEFQLQAPPRQRQSSMSEDSVITGARAQLDQMFADIRKFKDMDVGDILVKIAGMSGYASELRGQIQRGEARRLQSFRTRELDPFLEEIERQFKIWSRVQAVRQQEWDMSKGGI